MKMKGFALATIAACGVVAAHPAAQTAVPANVAKLLADIKAGDKDQLSVSEEDGRFLRVHATEEQRTGGDDAAEDEKTAHMMIS